MSAHGPLSEPELDDTTATAAPAATYSDRTGGPSRRRIGLVAGGAIALVAVAAATSLAASPAPSTTPDSSTNGAANGAPGNAGGRGAPGFAGRPGPMLRDGGIGLRQITITAIDGNQITLGTPDGWRRTITVSSEVKLTKGGQSIAASDLKVGDQVRFRQSRNNDGTFTVTDLAVVVPTVRGKVSGVTSSGFKLTTRDGSVWTIATNGSTKVRLGEADGALSDVKDGATVVVAGSTTGDNAMTALSIGVAPDRAVGTVTAKTADTITIKARNGSSLVIHVTAATTFRVAGKDSATLSDVTVGMFLGASGRARADGSLDATQVGAASADLFRNGRGNGNGGLKGFGKRFDVPSFVLPGVFGPNDDDGTTPTA